jgi:hypothetical protein
VPVLNDVSGLDLGPNPPAWQKWFLDLLGHQPNQLRASETPTVVEEVPLGYQPQPIALNSFLGPIDVVRTSCFGPGTLVRTLSGLEPIESLKVGEQVLAQNTQTGALAYKPILLVHHIAPSRTIRLKLGDETADSSHFEQGN